MRDSFEASVYPRTYAVSVAWKLFLVPFGFLLGAGGIGGLIFLSRIALLSRAGNKPIWSLLFLSVVAMGFAAMGIYSALSALIYRVALTVDGVEVIEPFRRRQLSFGDIKGRRTLRSQQGPSTLVLVPKAESAKKIKISFVLKRDEAFDAWMARLPDLDQEELDRSEQQVAEALYHEQMPHERKGRIKRLKLVARWLNGATIALAVAGFVLPDDDHIVTATLIALPWVAVWLVARFQPLYRFGAKGNDAHPDLTALLMFPGFVLTGRLLTDVHAFDWQGPMMLAFAGGLALSSAALRVDPWFRQQRWSAILTCVLTLAYGFGAGFNIDVLADSTNPTIYPTPVVGKRVSRGSRSRTYHLKVGAWGPITGDDEISVSAARYGAIRVGDTVCIYVGKGALQVPWYQARDCSNQ
jgi:hypothetical protein